MPPPNPQRRVQLADVAMQVLAQKGSRGLTHRAVDAAAGAPPGTTSRYFRSRDALLGAVVEHALQLHLVDVDPNSAELTIGEDDLADQLAAVVRDALGPGRLRHIAVAELYLESSRRPELHATMAEATRRHLDGVRSLFAAAGAELSEDEVLRFVSFVDGLLFVLMTAPPSPPAEDLAESLLRQQVADLLARQKGGGSSVAGGGAGASGR